MKATRLVFFFSFLGALIILMAGLRPFQVHAIMAGTPSRTEIQATRTRKPEKPPSAAYIIPRLCGRLVFVTEQGTGVTRAALNSCSFGKLYIFAVNPRDMVPYYQIRDATISSGPRFLSNQFGPLDLYITAFDNYVGIDSCSQCGKYMPPPTWTHAPLTPYTPTPIPPTRTPYVPSPTSTDTPTLAPWQVTETPGMFERLYGTYTPTGKPALTAEKQIIPTVRGSPTEDNPVEKDNPLTHPLVIFIGALLLSVFLTYLVYIWTIRQK